MKCAVVYYSNSGNTKRIAEEIGRRFSAELIFVEPEVPYGGFLSAVARVVREHKNPEDPRPKQARADLSSYDLLFLGFPVWAGTMPRFMQAFVRNSAPSGKTVIPFATAMGTGKDSALATVRALLPDCEVADYFYTSMREKPDVEAWLEGVAKKYGNA